MGGRARAMGASVASAGLALNPRRWWTPEPASSNCPHLGGQSGRVTDARPCLVELGALSYGAASSRARIDVPALQVPHAVTEAQPGALRPNIR
jgi:hypothetical protein